ncbi:hypothetical protein B0H19DRAFT_1153903 [Mycena capillaripes]|nr:hypothetical protein B0H19DRAFT_1153903 [Mycena capillaripes]
MRPGTPQWYDFSSTTVREKSVQLEFALTARHVSCLALPAPLRSRLVHGPETRCRTDLHPVEIGILLRGGSLRWINDEHAP